ncbi:hypothetical protein ACIBQX_36355 [Nonomuraea sp. NPDC049714]|uniref:hypothetical protein n=1 Tax=Nonomuraea sp. NPDC049714 TaxID=3364357 RepID=UPI0037B810ED
MRKILISLGITVAVATGATATAEAENWDLACKNYKMDGLCDMSWTEETMGKPLSA